MDCSTRHRFGRRTNPLAKSGRLTTSTTRPRVFWPGCSGQGVLDGVDEAVLVAAIDTEGLDPGAGFHQALNQGKSSVLILNIRRRHVHRQQASVTIDREMPLAALDLF